MGWYRASGADLPFGDPRLAHGVAMEGYFWRFTLPDGRVLIALAGVNRAAPARGHAPPADRFGPSEAHWSTLALAAHPGGFLRQAEFPSGAADPQRFGVSAGQVFRGNHHSVRVDLGADARLRAEVLTPRPWPRRLFGGSS